MAPGDKAEGCGGRGSPRGVSREESPGWDWVCGQHRHPTMRPFGDQKKQKSELDRFNNVQKYPRHIVEWEEKVA